MKDHRDDALVLEAACAALRNIDTDLNSLMKMGAGEYLLEALRTHTEKPKMVENACCLLRSLGRSLVNTEYLIANGAPEVVRTIMIKYQTNARIQLSCLGAIWSLCNREENKPALWKAGLPSLVLEAMERHSYDPMVGEVGCIVISGLGRYYTQMKLGACETVVGAIKASSYGNARALIYGCEAVRALSTIGVVAHKLVAIDILGILVDLCRSFSKDGRVIASVCRALYSLCLKEDVRNRLQCLAPDIGEFSLKLLRTHLGTLRVVHACVPLIMLLSTDAAYVPTLMELDCGTIIVKAGDLHPKNVEVQKGVLVTLLNICATEDDRKDILAEGGMNTVNSAVKNHPENELVSKYGPLVVSKLKTAIVQ
eukprot:CAMPEP_0184071074 /NCGR_PEP_ID=MMETSP0957-20130417/52859_1 /TAXON_ID=627963 /ORGANISM="Aplanochytrium sp, Strain PBS07" /LENGTH=367 /DNA_ID=CAMNT_0026371407 /DNA_START=90 /DNA_END=1193 /DNA_ORIENTATION=-